MLCRGLAFRKPERGFYKSVLLTRAGQPYFYISVPLYEMWLPAHPSEVLWDLHQGRG